jgi:phytol kinase
MLLSVIKVTCVIIFLVSFYFFLDLVKKKYNIQPERTRKLAHLLSGATATILFFLFTYWEFAGLLIFFSIFFIFAKINNVFSSIHLKSRKTFGEIFFPLGLLLIVFFSYHNKFIALSATAIMTISDTLAEIVGIYFNSKKKSLAGSAAFFVSAVIIIAIMMAIFHLPFTLLTLIGLLATAISATITEAFSKFGLDNLTIPILTLLMLSLFF